MLTLKQYLAANDMNQAEFAARIGVTQGTVSKLCAGRRPSWAMAAKIADVTGGQVPVGVWVLSSPASDAA